MNGTLLSPGGLIAQSHLLLYLIHAAEQVSTIMYIATSLAIQVIQPSCPKSMMKNPFPLFKLPFLQIKAQGIVYVYDSSIRPLFINAL